jgi:hypothetical protein
VLIKDYSILSKDKSHELIVDIEIEDIKWDNDSIGWYEYCGHVEYDYRQDYVSEFIIDAIYCNDKIIHSKKIFKFLTDILYEDESLLERIEKLLKEDGDSDKLERLIECREAI